MSEGVQYRRNRVPTLPGKPGKTLNSGKCISRYGKTWKISIFIQKPGKTWNLGIPEFAGDENLRRESATLLFMDHRRGFRYDAGT